MSRWMAAVAGLVAGGAAALVPTVAQASPVSTVTDVDRSPWECVTNTSGTFCYGSLLRFTYVSKGAGEVITGTTRSRIEADFADGYAVTSTHVNRFTVVRDIGGAEVLRSFEHDVTSIGGETCTFEARYIFVQQEVRVDVRLASCTSS